MLLLLLLVLKKKVWYTCYSLSIELTLIVVFAFNLLYFLLFLKPTRIFIMKYIISIPLMSENPVSKPMVPPITDSLVSKLALTSLVIRSNVGLPKEILTQWSSVL